MPKRIIDADKMWDSTKLAQCRQRSIPEYAWMYGIADANGNFELTNLRGIHGKVYAAIRPSFSLQDLKETLEDFHSNGLLYRWTENGKTYGHWTGSDKPGRLPPQSQRNHYPTIKVEHQPTAEDIEKYYKALAQQDSQQGKLYIAPPPEPQPPPAPAAAPAAPKQADETVDSPPGPEAPRCKCCNKTIEELIPLDVWLEFKKLRKHKGHPIDDSAADLFKRRLFDLHVSKGQDVTEMLERSVRRGWGDVFVSKDSPGKPNGQPPAPAKPIEFMKPIGPFRELDPAGVAIVRAYLKGKTWPKPKTWGKRSS